MVDQMPLPETMFAIVTTGNGGYEKLEAQTVPVPELAEGDVLLRVLAAGVNNTEINTRLGWYSSSVTAGTDAASTEQDVQAEHKSDGGWNAKTPFPLIQGTDCCGRIVRAGSDRDADLIGKRVIVRACMRPNGYESPENIWMASDFDGAFAQYVKVPASEVFAVECDWTDAELATIPCAYGTAETMLHRSGVTNGDVVLVAGASGGVGSATVQLAKRRGAQVIAIAGAGKTEQVAKLGADQVIERGRDLVEVLGERSVNVVIDNVAGPGFAQMLKVLKQGGRYASSGAIAGPIVDLDMRDMYLKDVTLYGSTAWDEPVFPNLVSYIELGEIRPVVAKIRPLSEIAEAQKEFLTKKHIGNFVLIPPQDDV
jgi:NADPH:quinone reductase-like Zn-dependent oxidoreductase